MGPNNQPSAQEYLELFRRIWVCGVPISSPELARFVEPHAKPGETVIETVGRGAGMDAELVGLVRSHAFDFDAAAYVAGIAERRLAHRR